MRARARACVYCGRCAKFSNSLKAILILSRVSAAFGHSCLPTNHGFLRLFSTVKLRKYSSKPLTGFAWGWTDRVPSTSGSLPSLTNPLALQPSLPIQEKAPVALQRLTALMTPATSWSEPKIMQPAAGHVDRVSSV